MEADSESTISLNSLDFTNHWSFTRNSMGVIAVRLEEGDKVVGAVVVDPNSSLLYRSLCRSGRSMPTASASTAS
jgi:DNA gyrase/topoisomerase IV subunit A